MGRNNKEIDREQQKENLVALLTILEHATFEEEYNRFVLDNVKINTEQNLKEIAERYKTFLKNFDGVNLAGYAQRKSPVLCFLKKIAKALNLKTERATIGTNIAKTNIYL